MHACEGNLMLPRHRILLAALPIMLAASGCSTKPALSSQVLVEQIAAKCAEFDFELERTGTLSRPPREGFGFHREAVQKTESLWTIYDASTNGAGVACIYQNSEPDSYFNIAIRVKA